jgi:hypothetical protein
MTEKEGTKTLFYLLNVANLKCGDAAASRAGFLYLRFISPATRMFTNVTQQGACLPCPCHRQSASLLPGYMNIQAAPTRCCHQSVMLSNKFCLYPCISPIRSRITDSVQVTKDSKCTASYLHVAYHRVIPRPYKGIMHTILLYNTISPEVAVANTHGQPSSGLGRLRIRNGHNRLPLHPAHNENGKYSDVYSSTRPG